MVVKTEKIEDVGAYVKGVIDETQIEQLVDSAIVDADPNEIEGAINWAAVNCVGVEFKGGEAIITLEELAPDNAEFEEYLREAIAPTMSIPFEFVFEW